MATEDKATVDTAQKPDSTAEALSEQMDAAARKYLNAVKSCNWERDRIIYSRSSFKPPLPSYESYGATYDEMDALAAKGAVPSQKTLAFAVREYATNLTEKLVALGAKPTTDILLIALKEENEFMVATLLKLGARPDKKVLGYIAKSLGAKDEPVDELIDLAVRQNKPHMLKALLATGVPPREDTMYYVLEGGSTINIEELAAARKPTPEMIDYLVRNKGKNQYAGRLLIEAGAIPSRDTLDFIADKLKETAYIEEVRHEYSLWPKEPGEYGDWTKKFVADGGKPEDAPNAIMALILERNKWLSWEGYILEAVKEKAVKEHQPIPAHIVDYVTERLGGQGEPLDELVDRAVRQDEPHLAGIVIAAGGVSREDTLYYVLENRSDTLVNDYLTLRRAIINAGNPTPSILDYVVRERDWKPDAEDLIGAGAIPARQTIDYVAERLSETNEQLSNVWHLPYPHSNEQYRETEKKWRQLNSDLMKWQAWQKLLEKGLNGNPPASLPEPEKSPVAAEFASVAQGPQPEELSLVASVNEASAPARIWQRPLRKLNVSGILRRIKYGPRS